MSQSSKTTENSQSENAQNEHTESEQSDVNSDVNADVKDMMSEGGPPPEHVAQDVSAQELDDSVTIEVETCDESSEETREEPDPIEALRAELAEVEAKADEYLDRMQRTAAEYQNSRRRQEKQMADEIQRANGQLIKRLLPVLDDFNLAFENVPPHLSAAIDRQNGEEQTNGNGQAAETAWVSGFRQIHKKLVDTLAEQGLEMIDTSGPFDPALHEAIASEPSDSVESGHIIETLRAGYLYKGQVLRPALIRVAT